ncbi:MAG TPA: dTMP kinase [Streptosporangiaceae bacterium]|nr:dTMP kinase [Streptosporangiaceae bacterium]
MSTRGLFVSLDGPGGTGKTTTAALVRDRLNARGLQVHLTAEPSPAPLGQLIRTSTDTYHGMALACLVAGDRHHHLAAEICPRVEAGAIVLSDRYLPASLVLQRMDGLDWDTIWQLNTPVVVPDLAVIPNADPQILVSRLAARGAHSRFERLAEGPATESRLYHDTAARLASVGWPVCPIDTTASAPDEVAAIVTDRIFTLLADRSADDS